MKNDLLELLINPYSGHELKRENDSLVDTVTAERFPIKDGIPVLLREEEVKGLNKLYQKRYDWLAYFYDFMIGSIGSLFGGKEAFKSIAETIEVDRNDRVLETSIGTGMEIKNLLDHGKEADYFGLDISYGMLKKCRRNAEKWNINIGLVQGNAETLPFEDEVFDMVFHIGGINFFNNKAKAIEEMIRVAKPGANIYIGDETVKQIEKQPSIISYFYQKPDLATYEPPLQHIPNEMLNVVTHTLWNEMLYLVSFKKPN